jgi:hypothetical protein
MERCRIDRHGVGQMNKVDLKLGSEFRKAIVVPEISAERTLRGAGDMSREPHIAAKAGGLGEITLPRRDNNMQFGNLRLGQQAARHIERMTLDSREI